MPVEKIIIVPGCGNFDPRERHWYGWLAQELKKRGLQVHLQPMPDQIAARRHIWLEYLSQHCDSSTLIVGHSSGAEAAMRFAEDHKVQGFILVSACVTDLNFPSEKASGWYDGPWKWDAMKSNVSTTIHQFGSPGDPFIPMSEQRTVAHSLSADFHILSEERGHFMEKQFPELLECVLTVVDESISSERLASFDWLIDFKDIRSQILPHLPAEPDALVAVLGCGNSTLSEEVHDAGWARVWSVDSEAPVMRLMRERHQVDRPSMQWIVADLFQPLSDTLPDHSFHSVIDKGTLDAMLCAGPMQKASASLLCNASRMLVEFGSFVLISLHPPGLLSQLLAHPALQLGVEACFLVNTSTKGVDLCDEPSTVDRLPEGVCTLLVCRKTGALSPLAKVFDVEADHDRLLQRWFTQVDPLVTDDRKSKLARDWKSKCCNGEEALPMNVAHELMFSAAERSEYTLDYFCEDLEANGHSKLLTLDDAFAFLDENQ